METKNYTEVLIDGKIYTMGGYEEEGYLQRVASYLNSRIGELKQQSGFMRLPAELRTVQIYLNLADDYFKAKKVAEDAAGKLNEQERELYRLKHELVTAQMKLEQLRKAAEQSSVVAAEQTEYMKEKLGQVQSGADSAKQTPSQSGRSSKYHGKRQGGAQKKQYLPPEERAEDAK